jgi:hypothetical protein
VGSTERSCTYVRGRCMAMLKHEPRPESRHKPLRRMRLRLVPQAAPARGYACHRLQLALGFRVLHVMARQPVVSGPFFQCAAELLAQGCNRVQQWQGLVLMQSPSDPTVLHAAADGHQGQGQRQVQLSAATGPGRACVAGRRWGCWPT